MKVARALIFSLALAGAPALLSAPATAAPAKTAIQHGRIDLNSASQTDLERLQGIGPAMAKKIIDGRPYKSKDELVRRKIIPVSAYGPIKDHVIAHHTA
jgi:competence protein ComEA